MRKTQRKLALHRETLRTLSRRELGLAAGQAAENPTETCPYSGCFVCPTILEVEGG